MRYIKTFKLFEAKGATGTTETTVTKAEPVTVPFEYKFDKGIWSEKKNPDLEKTLRAQITPVTDYLKKYKNNTVTIAVQAGESKVTNYDNEASTRTKLDPGVLSSRRGETIRTILRKILDEYKAQNLFVNDPKIDVNYIIGETPYTQNVDDPNDPKYKEEQFVRFVLKVEGEQQKTTPPDEGGNLIPGGFTCSDNRFAPKSGSFTGVETDFLSDEFKFTYPDGSGKIVIQTNPVDVPDMFIYEYDGKKFSTGFLGEQQEYYLLMLGTIIGNVYKDKEKPWYFKDLTYKELSVDEATRILKESKGISDVNDLKYAFPDKELDPQNSKMFKKNKDIIPYLLDRSQVKPWKKKTNESQIFEEEGGESNWMVSMEKKEKINEFKLRVSGPIGQTAWSIKFQC